jgi:hypothetical protein
MNNQCAPYSLQPLGILKDSLNTFFNQRFRNRRRHTISAAESLPTSPRAVAGASSETS